ncbi:hypothetical protein [Lactobacillus delbrueckii]|uniref:hypothetical protein n=1 Tax=Lactobacillus delbrueckii TaxID=1584 RepID=UPI0012D75E95
MIFALGLATGLLVLLEVDKLVVVLVLVAAAGVFVAVESVRLKLAAEQQAGKDGDGYSEFSLLHLCVFLL